MTERSNKKKYPLCAAALALAVLLAGCAPAEGAAAATAQPTAEPTEAPTPTPEPEANPLTGEQGDYTNQRPVAVSIRTGDGSTPQWGIAAADVLIEGVTEGKTAGLTAVFASVDSVEKAGPVAPGRDLPLQLVLPLNAVPVHINKSVYASNLLNVLQYQDLDGYHAGTAGFAFDEDRANSGYREENCWYTTKDLINTGLATYNTDTAGANMPLFHFVQRKDPEQQNAKSLYITFSNKDTEELVYSPEVGLYLKNNADGSPMMDAGNNEQAAFTNVFVLYASSGVKDDGVTRQYDLTGGTGIYLTKGGWETIQWTKGDATAPLQLTDASGKTLDVNPGKSFLAIWGGYYGQALRLLDGDGNEQALPEKPALLDSAVPDEAAEAAEQAQQHAQALADAQDKLNQAQTALNEALQAQQDAAGTADSSDDDAASQRVAEAQAAYDAAAAELAALQPAEEPDGNTEPAADSAEEPQSEPDSANGENPKIKCRPCQNRGGIWLILAVLTGLLFRTVQVAIGHNVKSFGNVVAHPHFGVQAQAVATAGVGHPFLRLVLRQNVVGHHVHDHAAVGDAGSFLGMGAQLVFKQLHQHHVGAVVEGFAVLGTIGVGAAGGVHPLGKLRVLDQFSDGAVFKLAKVHLPQVLQNRELGVGKQHFRCLLGAQHGGAEHKRNIRILELGFQLLQLGAALRAQGQVCAAADIAAIQVALGQAVADQMQFIIFQRQNLLTDICCKKKDYKMVTK